MEGGSGGDGGEARRGEAWLRAASGATAEWVTSERSMDLLVQLAETGASLALAVQGGDSVLALKASLSSATGIAATHQILLHEGDQLKDEHLLSEHGLPARDARSKPVFLFNRSTLSHRAAPPEWRPAPAHELLVPESLSPEQLLRQPVGDTASPLVRALLDYERSFCLQLAQGSAMHECAAARIAAATESASAQAVQAAALGSAVANLRGFSHELSKRYAAFQKRYDEAISLQTGLAGAFEASVEALRCVELEPAVCELEGWQCGGSLLETVGEANVRAWLAEYQQGIDHLMAKAGQYSLQWAELAAGVQAEEDEATHKEPGAAENVVQRMEMPHVEQKGLLLELRRDVDSVRSLVDEQVLPLSSEGEGSTHEGSGRGRRNSTKLLEEVGELEKINERHVDVVLPRMRAIDAEMKAMQEKVAALKMGQQMHVYTRLRSISRRQLQISQAFNNLNLYSNLMDRLDSYSSRLAPLSMRHMNLIPIRLMMVQRLPETYRACLSEVIRRTDFEAEYAQQAHSAAEKIADAREEEVQLRDQFMRDFGSFLPPGLPSLASLLQARPAFFEISSSSSNNTLSLLSQALHASIGPSLAPSATSPAEARAAIPAAAAALEPSESGKLPIRRCHSTPANVGVWPAPFCAALTADDAASHLPRAGAVLSGRMPSELSKLSSALEALGTPLDGVPVEVASDLQQRLATQQDTSVQLRRQCDTQCAELEAAKARLEEEKRQSAELRRQLEEARQQLASIGQSASVAEGVKDSSTSPEASSRTTSSSPVQLTISVRTKEDNEAVSAILSPLRAELSHVEASHSALLSRQHALLSGVRVAMSCLPPPGPLRSSEEERSELVESASLAPSTGSGMLIEQMAADLCSSARQAAHANARLGHAMASERELHRAAAAAAARRLGYLSAEVNSRLLFCSQPSRHAREAEGVAFAALLFPTMRDGLPTHWLSRESVDSLCRWCEEEGVTPASIRYVVGRVVHVAGPLVAGDAAGQSNSSNPYQLPVGEQFYVVHAEMMLQHRWLARAP